MKFPFTLSIALLALSASASPVTSSDKALEARQFNWGNIDWGCTFSCAIWNYCRGRNLKSLQQSCGNRDLHIFRIMLT